MKKFKALVFFCSVLVIFIFRLPASSQEMTDPKLLEGAKKEGQVVWYTIMTLDQGKQVVDRFQAEYPFVKPVLFRTGGGPLLNRILAEAQAGRHAWDVAVGRAEMVLPLMQKKLLTSYRSPETKMIDDDLVDKQGFWTAYYVNTYVLGFNTHAVRKEVVPKSYEALLDPKWKGGNISIDTEAYGMLQGLIAAWGKEKAVDYFKRLAAQDPVPKRGHSIRVQMTVAGEHPLVIAYNVVIQRMTSNRAPIDWIPLEPAVVQIHPVVLAEKAPHRNAARLFIDFLLSKEGQEMFRRFQSVPVRRDVEPDPPRLFRGYKRVIENPESYANFDDTVKLYLGIFKLR